MATTYQASLTIDDIRTLYLNTELGGNQNSINVFSYAGTGTSAYSFGLPQFDVGVNNGNNAAAQFLLNNGFSSAQLSLLEQHGGLSQTQLSSLNTQLQQIPTSTLDQFTDSYLASNLDTLNEVLNALSVTNPAVAAAIAGSTNLQMDVLDYNNEFGISGLSASTPPANGMLSYLEGNTVTLPGGTVQLDNNGTQIGEASIQSFIDLTKYGQANPVSVQNRYTNLTNAETTVNNGQVDTTDGANSTYTSSLLTTSAGLGGDLTYSEDNLGDFTITGANGGVSLLQNGGLNVNASNSQFNFAPSVNATVQGSGNTLHCAADDQLTAGGDTILAGNQVFSLTDVGSTQNIVQGSGFTVTENGGLLCFDCNGTLSGSGNTLQITSDSTSNMLDGDNTVNMDSGSTLIDTSSDGGNTINGGAGDTIQVTNSSGSDTINASDDTGITLEASSSADLVGGGNTLTSGSGSIVTLQGNGNVVDATGGTIKDSANDTGNVFNGSQSLIIAGADFSGSVEGTGNSVNLVSNSGSSLILGGTGESVSSVGNQVDLSGSGTSATVTGVNTLSLAGTGESLTLATSGDTVDTSAGDTSETLNGSNLILNGGSGLFSGMVTGSNNTFNLDTNSNSILDINGTGNIANSSQNIVRLWGSDTSATISGVNLIGLDGSNQLLTLNSTGDAVDAAANISGESITGSGLTFTGSSDFSGWFTGSNSTFNLTANSGSALHVSGTNNLVDSTDNTILLASANTSATVSGVDTIGLDASNQSLALNSTGDAVDAAANISGETITGSGLTFTGSNDFSGWFTGSNSTFNLASDSGSALHVSGTDNLVNSFQNIVLLASADTSATISGVNTIGLDASNQLLTLNSSGDGLDAAANISGETVIGSGLSFTGSNDFSGWFTGSNNIFNLASDSGSALHVSGTDNLVNSFQNIVLLASANTSATISGVNTIGLDASNQSLTLNSSGDGLDAAANISGETITGSGLTFTGSNDFSGWFTGSNNIFNLATDSGSALHVSGTNNLVDSVQNTILLASAYTSATVSGANTIGLDASNQSLALQSSGSGVDAAANISGESITGSNLTCTGASNDNISINGDSAVINGGASDYFNLTGSNDTFNAGANDSLKWNSSNGQYTENAAYNASAGLSNEQLYSDTSGASTEVVSLANNTSNGQSTVQWYDGYDLPSGYSGWTETFGGQDASGQLLQETQTNTSDYTADIDYFYNSQGQLVDYSDTWYSSSGVDDGTAYYDPYGDLMSGYDSYDMTADAGSSEDDGFYGLAGTTQSINNALNSVGGGLTQSLLNTGTASDLATADIGLQRAANGASQFGSAAASPYEDAHWYPASKGKQEIEVTWSAAGAGGKFSGQLNASELAAVEQAFDTWGNASGIDFEEVSDPSKADIRVGLGDLDTATSGVAGYTDCQSVAGMMQGADIYLEDPNQDALVSQTSGDATYAGTSATLEQTALHEIGHALGLASNTDANSIMYYALTAGNRALDASDVSNVQSLYGYAAQGTAAPAAVSAMAMQSLTQVHQLVQAMSSFDAGEQGIDSNPMAEFYPQSTHMLVGSLSHAHAV